MPAMTDHCQNRSAHYARLLFDEGSVDPFRSARGPGWLPEGPIPAHIPYMRRAAKIRGSSYPITSGFRPSPTASQ